jgi:hypothetical protein
MFRFFVFFILIIPIFSFGQSRIVLKENTNGKMVKLKTRKVVGLITNTNDTLKYANLDAYPDKSYWFLKSFSDTSLTIEFKRTEEIRTYNFDNIKQISFKKNESTGSPLALAAGGFMILVSSPFIGIKKDKYDFEDAGTAFGVGTGLLSIVYLSTKNRELLKCSIEGVK